MSAADAPTGVVTFLFTDVEGSTRRWEADPRAMRAALAVHDEVLHSTIEANGGYLFKHTGDGVCAAFSSPGAAVDSAVTAQCELQLPVRMGIATGEAELRGADYFGAVLNRAARVMAAGHGGQILVAESTASLLSGVDLLELGPRRLRDLPKPVSVFQVRAPGLRSDFPPLKAVDTSPGNLRPAVTSLIGRDAEMAEVMAAVREHRLVTLSGVGGVGKTRLAIEVGNRLTNEFPDGTWFFELAAVSDAAAVPDAVAAVLGIAQQPGQSITESVAGALEGRTRLLVIDNCEHVLDAVADLVDAILTRSDTVKVMATSREGIGVADEQVWPVPSLGTDGGMDSAAATLFVERAHAVAPRFSPSDPAEATAVVEICRRLDGIPLAIELAASRMASMTARDVRDRLDQRFRLLVGSRRTLERHQTLRQAVAWSYDLLDEPERALLERCSVFAGGFDLESACAVAESADDYAVLDLLDALVRKSLLVAGRSAGRARYSMLETVRQFAEEQLAASGAAERVRAAHARHFSARENDVLAVWDSVGQREAYEWFAVELANLRNAFRWAADHGDLDLAAPIANYAALLGALVENYEPVAWAEELIAPAQAVDHPRLLSLYILGTLCFYAGRIEDAIRYSDAGRELFVSGKQAMSDLTSRLQVLFATWLGGIYIQIGQPQVAVDFLRPILENHTDTYAFTRAGMVFALMRAGSHMEAKAVAKDLPDIADSFANPWARSYALLTYGIVYCDADPSGAGHALRRGLTIARDSGNRYNESHIVNILGRLEAQHGNVLAALEYLNLAIRNYHDSGNTSVIRVPLAGLATILERLGRKDAAATIAGYALSPISKAWVPELKSTVARLRTALGDERYEALSRKGAAMTTAAVAACAYSEIAAARRQLEITI